MAKRKKNKQADRVADAGANYAVAPTEIGTAIVGATVVDDFLPPPKDLVFKEETVRVTLNLSRRSVDFMKREAKTQGVPYQQMVRKILDLYAERYD